MHQNSSTETYCLPQLRKRHSLPVCPFLSPRIILKPHKASKISDAQPLCQQRSNKCGAHCNCVHSLRIYVEPHPKENMQLWPSILKLSQSISESIIQLRRFPQTKSKHLGISHSFKKAEFSSCRQATPSWDGQTIVLYTLSKFYRTLFSPFHAMTMTSIRVSEMRDLSKHLGAWNFSLACSATMAIGPPYLRQQVYQLLFYYCDKMHTPYFQNIMTQIIHYHSKEG